MAEPANKAVFLSYASQDVGAARRICEALRSGGVEVWFDAEGGLEHGDEWDQKIRRQIKECVLFIPVISASTQARQEGYFRIEWELAAQRAMGIASGVPFILPVVIDHTSEPDALVPDRFRMVQWMRLPGGVVPSEVRARLLKLWSHRTRALAHEIARDQDAGASSGSTSLAGVGRKPKGMSNLLVAVAMLGVAAVAGWWFWRKPAAAPVVAGSMSVAKTDLPPAAAGLPSEAAALIARTRHFYDNVNYGPADLALAEKFMAQATDLAPDSAEAWALRGFVQATYVQRTWDYSAKRLQDAQNFCNQALALDPNQTEAMLGLAIILDQQAAYDQAQALLRRAIQLRPDDSHLYRMLGITTWESGHTAEGLAILKDATRRFPDDPMVWYEIGRICTLENRLPEALDADRHVVARAPVAGAYVSIAQLLAKMGDLEGARAAYDQIPMASRTGDRAVGLAMWLGLLENKPERVIAAAGLTATDYFDDSNYRGPKAFYSALACEMAGKRAAADREWDAGIAVLRERLQDGQSQGSMADFYRILLAIAFAWKGNESEAASIMAPLEAAQREVPNDDLAGFFARYHAARGEARQAISCLGPPTMLRNAWGIQMNPWFMKIRNTPEFRAYLAELERAQPRDGPVAGSPK
jgi:tetratricopeptide (TPR) repeat protein